MKGVRRKKPRCFVHEPRGQSMRMPTQELHSLGWYCECESSKAPHINHRPRNEFLVSEALPGGSLRHLIASNININRGPNGRGHRLVKEISERTVPSFPIHRPKANHVPSCESPPKSPSFSPSQRSDTTGVNSRSLRSRQPVETLDGSRAAKVIDHGD